MPLPDNTEPSAEALSIASAYFRNGVERELALARFRAAGVREERERCAAISMQYDDCNYGCNEAIAENIESRESVDAFR